MDIAVVKAAVAEVSGRAAQVKSGKLSKEQAKAAFGEIEKALFVLEDAMNDSGKPQEKAAVMAPSTSTAPASLAKPSAVKSATKEEKKSMFSSKKRVSLLSKSDRSDFLRETGMDNDYLKGVIAKKKKGISEEDRVMYTLYSTSEYGKFANRFFEKYTVMISKKYPKELESFYQSLRISGIKVLSKTYISMIFLTAAIAFIAVTLLASIFYSASNIVLQVLRGLLIGVLAAGLTGVIMYFYPSSAAKSREGKIKQDLPFVIINMAAIAGSGAKPISIFKTILSSKEYPGLIDEIKKIVNYVNLFGYDLSTALKAVARRTPSLKFKDLLSGIINTIESGGDLKEYLNAIADEALTTYRLERKKAVEQIETYSDIYTTILIAAPLLFFVTLAIIQSMGGEIGGISVTTLSTVGTYLVIPVLNVCFIIFIDAVQPQG